METRNESAWIITNYKNEFVRACANREHAKADMESWRDNYAKSGIFREVTKVDAVNYDVICFTAITRSGEERKITAREVYLW